MQYPRFYKNNNRYTCLKSATEFIQVNTMQTVSTITFGNNEHYINDSLKYDVEITADEFEKALHQKIIGVYSTKCKHEFISKAVRVNDYGCTFAICRKCGYEPSPNIHYNL